MTNSGISSPTYTNSTQSSQDVGLIFVREYYTFLNKKPNRLHAFYSKDSLFVRGDEGTVTETARGQEEIGKQIELSNFQDCKVLVTQVDSQLSANDGILIHVLGEMCNQNSPSQKFSQTFFLATQPNGYYVLNDIFRFLKDEVEIDYYTCEDDEGKKTTTVSNTPEDPLKMENDEKEEPKEEQKRDVKEEIKIEVEDELKKEVKDEKKELKEDQKKDIKEDQKKEPKDDLKKDQSKKESKKEFKKDSKKEDGKKSDSKKSEAKKFEKKSDSKKEDSKKAERKEELKKDKVEKKQEAADAKKLESAAAADSATTTPANTSPVTSKASTPKELGESDEKKKKFESKQANKQSQQKQEPPKTTAPKTWANLAAVTSSPTATAASPVSTPATAVSPSLPHTLPATTTEAPATVAPTTESPVINNTEKPVQHLQPYQNKNQTPRNKEPMTQIFVKQVFDTVTEDHLRDAFSAFGPIKNINISKTKNNAFIEFQSPETVPKALSQHKVFLANGNYVLAEERRFGNQINRYNNNSHGRNQNYNNGNTGYERRPNNHRRQGQNTRNNNANNAVNTGTANNGNNTNNTKGKSPNTPK